MAVVNCDSGVASSGTVISSYLIFNSTYRTSREAIKYFETARCHSRIGVTTPSQKRYVSYVKKVIVDGEKPFPKRLLLQKIMIKTVPKIDALYGCTPFFKIFNAETFELIATNRKENMRRYTTKEHFVLFEANVELQGDVVVRIYNFSNFMNLETEICKVAFHTAFVSNMLDFNAFDIDAIPVSSVLSDSRFNPDVQIRLFFKEIQEGKIAVPIPLVNLSLTEEYKKDESHDKKDSLFDEKKGVDDVL